MAVKKMGKADYSRIYLQDAVLEKKKFVVFDTETRMKSSSFRQLVLILKIGQ